MAIRMATMTMLRDDAGGDADRDCAWVPPLLLIFDGDGGDGHLRTGVDDAMLLMVMVIMIVIAVRATVTVIVRRRARGVMVMMMMMMVMMVVTMMVMVMVVG